MTTVEHRRVLIASSLPLLRAGLARVAGPHRDDADDAESARRLAPRNSVIVCTAELGSACIAARHRETPVWVIHTETLVRPLILPGKVVCLPHSLSLTDLMSVVRGFGVPDLARRRPHILRPLSVRQESVLSSLAAGASGSTIARDLGISASSTKTHVSRLMATLSCSTRTELVALATLWVACGGCP